MRAKETNKKRERKVNEKERGKEGKALNDGESEKERKRESEKRDKNRVGVKIIDREICTLRSQLQETVLQ